MVVCWAVVCASSFKLMPSQCLGVVCVQLSVGPVWSVTHSHRPASTSIPGAVISSYSCFICTCC